MNRRSEASAVRRSGYEEAIAPVTILDGQGRVVRVIPAEEFRRATRTYGRRHVPGEAALAGRNRKVDEA
jgi:hypothetical protein